MKWCSRCKLNLPVQAFSKRRASVDGLNVWCKACYKAYRTENQEHINTRQQLYREKNLDKIREWDRKRSRKYTLSRYVLTEEMYDALVATQDGVCAICKTASSDRLVVDHCHQSNRVRGLLCRTCNAAIGQLKDDPQLVREAARYLEAEFVV